MSKIIHYCWFGNKKMGEYAICCMRSWQKYFPDYKIQVWNENNFDVSSVLFVKQAYEKKAYAFVSDYVRLYALYNYGGIYFDTDYEVFKNFENLLNKDLTLSFESENAIQTCFISSKKNNEHIRKLLDIYNTMTFSDLKTCTNVKIISDYLFQLGIRKKNIYQTLDNIEIYPTKYFCPINFLTGQIQIEKETVGIHFFEGSWLSENQKQYFINKRKFGKNQAVKIRNDVEKTIDTNSYYSIIITFYQNKNMLEVCLNTLLHSLRNRNDYEIIIVNDNEFYKLKLSELNLNYFSTKIKIINNKINLGYSGACNVGANYSKGDSLIFLDSDIIVDERWLIEIEKVAKMHPDFGAISSKILKQSDFSVEYFGMLLYEVDSIKPKFMNNRKNKYTNQDKEFHIVTSGCMLVTSSNFFKIGGFDESLYNSHCDLDFSLRLSPKKNYIASNSIAYHRGSTSGSIRHSAYLKARSYFFKKWANLDINAFAIKELKTMYAEYRNNISSKYFKLINFSNTRYDKIYINALKEALDIEIISEITLRNPTQNSIFLFDLVNSSYLLSSVPIIYFVDNFNLMINNKTWFEARKFKRDLIVDWNGNIIFINEI